MANRVRVITLRRDRIHFDDIADIIAGSLTITGGLELLASAKAQWDQAKIGTMPWSYQRGDEKLTTWRAFELWFYGSVAHANADKVEEFDRMDADALDRHMLRLKVQEFLTGVLEPLDTVCMLAEHLVDTGREPKTLFKVDGVGRVWAVSLVDGSETPAVDFSYSAHGMPTPPQLDTAQDL